MMNLLTKLLQLVLPNQCLLLSFALFGLLNLESVRGNSFDGWVDCGAPRGKCHLSCDDYKCSDMSNNRDYDYCCYLKDVDYSEVTIADASLLDLSGLKLKLDYIEATLDYNQFPRNQVETLILADNFYFYHNISDVVGFINLLPNLKNLNISNITIPLRDAMSDNTERDVQKVWANHKDLFILEISANHNGWNVSSGNIFSKMVNLDQLNMSQCCDTIPDSISGAETSLFKDLVNLKSMDISYTLWEDLRYADSLLYGSQKLKYLNMAGLGNLPDVSKVFLKQTNLQSANLSYCAYLDVQNLKFESSNITELSLKGIYFHSNDFELMDTSFGLPEPASLKQLDLTASSVSINRPIDQSSRSNVVTLVYHEVRLKMGGYLDS